MAGELIQRSFGHVDAVVVKPWRASVAAYTVLVGVAFLHAYATWILSRIRFAAFMTRLFCRNVNTTRPAFNLCYVYLSAKERQTTCVGLRFSRSDKHCLTYPFPGEGPGTVCIVALFMCTGGRSDAQRHWKLKLTMMFCAFIATLSIFNFSTPTHEEGIDLHATRSVWRTRSLQCQRSLIIAGDGATPSHHLLNYPPLRCLLLLVGLVKTAIVKVNRMEVATNMISE